MKKITFIFYLTSFTLNVFAQQAQWLISGNGGTNPPTNYFGTSDDKDIVFKRNAQKSGILGINLTSFGFQSLSANSSGTHNTAIGSNALNKNTTGYQNVSIGSYSLANNTSGNQNSATGTYSLNQNTIGNLNSTLGTYSLNQNTTGSQNSAIGSGALQFNTTGYQNTAIGSYSLKQNISGLFNTAIGSYASANLTTGSYNTVVGYNSGTGLTEGSNNTIIGARVSGLAAGVSNSIILADGSGNQRIFVNDAGNVGIGTTNLTANLKLQVNGNIYSNGKILINSDLSHSGNYALSVNGDAVFTRAVVKLYGSWPDYVFDKKYKLKPLEEVEKYIRQKKHLEGMQSESEVWENGIDLGENQKKMLEKIEELTLYIIEQHKALILLKEELNLLKKNAKN